MNLFVLGLWHNITLDQLYALFNEYADVDKAKLIQDTTDTGKPKIYGVIEISDEQEATNAIRELDGKNVNGRILSVKKVRTKSPKK